MDSAILGISDVSTIMSVDCHVLNSAQSAEFRDVTQLKLHLDVIKTLS